MTGRPGAGQWKWMEEVPRRTSLALLAFPSFVLRWVGVETEGPLDYQRRAGIISIVRWNVRPIIFGVEKQSCFPIWTCLSQVVLVRHVGDFHDFFTDFPIVLPRPFLGLLRWPLKRPWLNPYLFNSGGGANSGGEVVKETQNKQAVFGQSTPLIKGVHLNPLLEGVPS